jgi:predicted RNA-binding protein with PIN domain
MALRRSGVQFPSAPPLFFPRECDTVMIGDAGFILVDGYSVIHAWPSLRAAMGRGLERARDELVAEMIQLQDLSGARVVVVFDGRGGRRVSRGEMPAAVEVVFTGKGLTADSLIERMVARARAPERLMVVTNDGAEARAALGFGAGVVTAEELHDWLGRESAAMRRTAARIRRTGVEKFRRSDD